MAVEQSFRISVWLSRNNIDYEGTRMTNQEQFDNHILCGAEAQCRTVKNLEEYARSYTHVTPQVLSFCCTGQ